MFFRRTNLVWRQISGPKMQTGIQIVFTKRVIYLQFLKKNNNLSLTGQRAVRLSGMGVEPGLVGRVKQTG